MEVCFAQEILEIRFCNLLSFARPMGLTSGFSMLVGNSLYGLQHMDTDDDGVNALVRALTSKIKSSSSEMNGQEIGNALYGLRTMSSSSIAVRELLTAITQKIMASNQELNAQVSSILHKFPTHKRLSRYTYLSFICYRR